MDKSVDFSILFPPAGASWSIGHVGHCGVQCGIPKTGKELNEKTLSAAGFEGESDAVSEEGSQETLLENRGWDLGQEPQAHSGHLLCE